MENALLVGLSRQMALARELDVVANNVANMNTAGFKARSLRFEEFIGPNAKGDAFPAADRQISFTIDKGSGLDLSTGAIERTGNPLDVAIVGEGLFVVSTPAGERYTRNGAFQINANGQLVALDGNLVLGDGGPIVFNPGETAIAVAADGSISSSEGQKGRLRLVAAQPGSLAEQGDNLFSASTPPAISREARVQGGAIERSNVRPVVEMSRLIEVNRAYASVSSMLQRLDEMRKSSLDRLASVQN